MCWSSFQKYYYNFKSQEANLLSKVKHQLAIVDGFCKIQEWRREEEAILITKSVNPFDINVT